MVFAQSSSGEIFGQHGRCAGCFDRKSDSAERRGADDRVRSSAQIYPNLFRADEPVEICESETGSLRSDTDQALQTTDGDDQRQPSRSDPCAGKTGGRRKFCSICSGKNCLCGWRGAKDAAKTGASEGFERRCKAGSGKFSQDCK